MPFLGSFNKKSSKKIWYLTKCSYLCNPLLKKGTVLRKNHHKFLESFRREIKKYFQNILKTFGRLNKGSYFCTPIKKLVVKKGQKIFESLEVTAQNFYNST